MSRPPKFTARQQRFVEEYLVDLNATQAAIRSGYSARTAEKIGSALLRKPHVAAAVSAAQAARSERTGITADVVLQELLRLARVDIGEAFDEHGALLPLKQMPEAVRRAIAAVEVEQAETSGTADDGEFSRSAGRVVKIKLWDKVRGLELLGKHLKLFTEKLEHSGKDGAPLGVVILPAVRD